MRFAMMLCPSIGSPMGDQIVNGWRRCHHVIGRDDPDWNNMLGGDDDRVRCRGHHGVEVASGQSVGKVAEIVGQKRMDQCKVSA